MVANTMTETFEMSDGSGLPSIVPDRQTQWSMKHRAMSAR